VCLQCVFVCGAVWLQRVLQRVLVCDAVCVARVCLQCVFVCGAVWLQRVM